ncbi:MAG: ABC transporter ATP-binding protein [Roseburia sp.]|nr:ABC transporter ATP-binding protein [Roseburia sp.]
MKPELAATHIKKSYQRGKKLVLQDVSFSAEAGQCIGILGENGSGKSTLLSLLAGTQKADAGTLLYCGKPLLSESRETRQLIGYVPQENPLIEELSAYDNLRLWYCDAPLSLEQELKDGVLAMLGIHEFLNVRVSRMSGGMKKRLSIGCAIAGDPPVLLLDEPGAALDLICKERISVYLKNCLEQGKIVLLATHEEREIELCDKLYVLKDGVLSALEYDGNIHHLAGQIHKRRV